MNSNKSSVVKSSEEPRALVYAFPSDRTRIQLLRIKMGAKNSAEVIHSALDAKEREDRAKAKEAREGERKAA